MRNLSYENEYDLHSNGLVSKTHFHMKGFALGLVLKQRQKRTRKWPIDHRHTERVTTTQQVNNSKYHVGVSIRKVRICKTILALTTWTKPCENVQHIRSGKTYGPNENER